MKKIVFMVLAAFVAVMPLCAANPTLFPSGIATGYDNVIDITPDTNTITGVVGGMGANDSWFGGDVNIKGRVNTTGSEGLFSQYDWFLNVPAADTDTLRAPTGGLVITTSTLISGATCFVNKNCWTLNKYARDFCTSFDVKFDSNYVTGMFAVTYIDARGISRYENMAVLTTTKTWSNYPMVEIVQSTLTLTSHPYGRGEPSGSLLLYDDSAKIYPRFGTGVNIGLSGMPAVDSCFWLSEGDTAKYANTAVVVSTSGWVRFPTAPNATNDYEIGYFERGNR